jgi:hypothetical protein
MRFYSPSRHFQLRRDFGIVTALQQQFNDLLFPRSQTDRLFPDAFALILHALLLARASTAGAGQMFFPKDVASGLPI